MGRDHPPGLAIGLLPVRHRVGVLPGGGLAEGPGIQSRMGQLRCQGTGFRVEIIRGGGSNPGQVRVEGEGCGEGVEVPHDT